MSCLGSCCKVNRWKSKFLRKGFPGGSDGKESACNTEDLGSIPGWKDPLEKEMATYSSILAWGIPWTEEPGGLQSMGSQRVRHDWATNAYLGWGSQVEMAILSPGLPHPGPSLSCWSISVLSIQTWPVGELPWFVYSFPAIGRTKKNRPWVIRSLLI